MIVQIEIQNPKDGTDSYDQIKLYRSTSTDETSNYTLLSTNNINMDSDTHSTLVLDTNGDDDYYYRATYYNSTTSEETALADAPSMKGNTSFLLKYISLLLKDPTNANYSLDNLKTFRDVEISMLRETLAEKYVKDDIDGSSTLYAYNLDDNVIEVSSVWIKEDSSNYWSEVPIGLWKLVKNDTGGYTLYFKFLASTKTIKVIGLKRVLGEEYLPSKYDDLIAKGVVIKVIESEMFKIAMQSSGEGDKNVLDALMKLLKIYKVDYENLKAKFTIIGQPVILR